MTYQPIGSGKVRDWLWAGVVVLSMAAGVLWFFWYLDPFEGQAPAQPAQQTVQTVPSAEWTTAPEGEHIEVKLPETQMRRVPIEPAKASAEAEGQ